VTVKAVPAVAVRGAVNSRVACFVPQPKLSSENVAKLIVRKQARNHRFGNRELSDAATAPAWTRAQAVFGWLTTLSPALDIGLMVVGVEPSILRRGDGLSQAGRPFQTSAHIH